MTLRAIIIGLLGGIAIATLGYMNDQVLQFDRITSGHMLPASVIGTMILALVVVNPVLFAIRRTWAFKPAEVAVIALSLLVSCSIPGRPLLEEVVPALGLPAYHNSDTARGWKKNNLLSYLHPAMLPADGRLDPEVSNGLVSGLGEPDRPIGLDVVPWAKWATPLTVWLPLIGLTMVSTVCISLIVHRQWSSNERLRYPIAVFTTTLMDRPAGAAIGPIFRNKLFWLGLGAILLVHVNNGICLWTNDQWVRIQTSFDFSSPINDKFPKLKDAPWGSSLAAITMFPVVIGFSYFLASEISMSLGLTQLIFVPLSLVLISYGVNMSTDYVGGGVGGWQRFGSYLALCITLLYTGRRYYRQVLKAAVTFRAGEGMDRYAAWACRILLLAVAAMVGIAVSMGLPWTMAIVFFLVMLVMYVGLTRVTAETGLFYIQPRWQPLGVMVGFFGGYAMGPEAMVMIGLLGVMLCIDIGISLMPYFSNCLKMCEDLGVRPSRATWQGGGTWMVAAALGLIVALWASYNYGLGTRKDTGWGFRRVTYMCFDVPNKEVTKLKFSGELAQSIQLGPLERLTALRPNNRFLAAAGAGLVLVLAFGILRLRLSWWPLHPVMFLVWDTYPMANFAPSILLGFLIKAAVSRLGGHKTYQDGKPLMIGLIAGDLLGVMLWMAVSVIYYAYTGMEPKIYRYYPK